MGLNDSSDWLTAYSFFKKVDKYIQFFGLELHSWNPADLWVLFFFFFSGKRLQMGTYIWSLVIPSGQNLENLGLFGVYCTRA